VSFSEAKIAREDTTGYALMHIKTKKLLYKKKGRKNAKMPG